LKIKKLIGSKNNKMLEKFEIKGVTSKTIDPKKYTSIFKEFGVVVFRDFFSNDPDFNDYYNDIKKLALIIAKKCNIKIDSSLLLNEILTILSKSNRDEVGNLYDLGTRPIKLLSGLKLKTNPAVISFIKAIMGEDAVLGFPYLGETLHIFPPGKENTKYNLPMHQDYPYIMQSPDQITAYFNLGELQKENNGGIRVWAGSHSEGISPSTKSVTNHRITSNHTHFENKYKSYDISFGIGDFAIFDSLIQHEGIQNHSDCTRVVQLIRYSNLMNSKSISYSWKSTDPSAGRGIKFEDVHSF
jgi:hypothetical protein